jgi:hypothetical protein
MVETSKVSKIGFRPPRIARIARIKVLPSVLPWYFDNKRYANLYITYQGELLLSPSDTLLIRVVSVGLKEREAVLADLMRSTEVLYIN